MYLGSVLPTQIPPRIAPTWRILRARDVAPRLRPLGAQALLENVPPAHSGRRGECVRDDSGYAALRHYTPHICVLVPLCCCGAGMRGRLVWGRRGGEVGRAWGAISDGDGDGDGEAAGARRGGDALVWEGRVGGVSSCAGDAGEGAARFSVSARVRTRGGHWAWHRTQDAYCD